MAKTDLILGTAGHIDHGKSSLVKALTGTDPDRLAEEKERGITIALGFAQLTLPSGRKAGVVDVPGHERFVRQMVSGATGIDVALLVIAADDGIMPQTVEHIAVLELLGVQNVVVALTKVDMVDEDWAQFVAEEVSAALEKTSFAGAPVVRCSSVTGQGLDELKQVLDDTLSHSERTKPQGKVRYPIDRVFTVKGFGTVVTGTLWSGTVHVGDELEILPQQKRSKVRSIQVHGKDTSSACAGNRVAICLADLSCDEVRPGDFAAAPGCVEATDRFDAELFLSDPFKTGKPLKTGSRVHVAHGTREVCGRVLCMNGLEQIEPGQRTLVQIRLECPLPVSYQDRFVIRSFSPVHVIGGGSVVMAHPKRRTNLKEPEEGVLSALAAGKEADAVCARMEGLALPVTAKQAASSLGLDERLVENQISRMAAAGELAQVEGAEVWFIQPQALAALLSSIESKLMRFHNQNPDKTGIGKEELRILVDKKLDNACFDALLQRAQARKIAVVLGNEVSHPKASAGAKAQVDKAAQEILAALEEGGSTPPAPAAISAQLKLSASLAAKAQRKLADEGSIVRVADDIVFAASTVEQMRQAVADAIRQNGPLTASQLKDACNTSRKYMMPLLEWMDANGITKRTGDLRDLA